MKPQTITINVDPDLTKVNAALDAYIDAMRAMGDALQAAADEAQQAIARFTTTYEPEGVDQ